MLPLFLYVALLVSPNLDGPDASRMRESLERMHASMQATFKRDRGGVERFYTSEATIAEATRAHTGRAAILEFWTRVPWTGDLIHHTFDVGSPDAGIPWEAGRYVGRRPDGVQVETFFVRLLQHGPDGEWKILGEAQSPDPGTGTAAELAAAEERWLKGTAPGAATVEGQLARIYGSLGVTRAVVDRAGGQESCTGIWIQTRSVWRLAAGRCQ